MKIILRVQALAAAAIVATGLALAGCETIAPFVGQGTQETVRDKAEYVFEGFRTVWIPALGVYRNELPMCGQAPAPCWEPKVYAKLHAATDVATRCMEASTAPGLPLGEIQACIATVEAAKAVYMQNGVAPKEAGQ